MENYPKISIVTPSYNQGEYIEQTILSIINQKYPNLEYIIIDGGSTDNTLNIIKKYEKHLAYWVSEPDNGQSHAINKGIEKCTGEIFNWINSDDYLAENSLFEIAKKFTQDCDILAGNYYLFDDRGIWESRLIKTQKIRKLSQSVGSYMHQPCTFWRLSIIKELGKLNENLKYVMDQELWIKYHFTYGIQRIKVHDFLYAYFRIHDKSKTENELQNLFKVEYYSLFYSMAIKLNLKQYAKLISKNYKVNPDIDFKYIFFNKKKKAIKTFLTEWTSILYSNNLNKRKNYMTKFSNFPFYLKKIVKRYLKNVFLQTKK